MESVGRRNGKPHVLCIPFPLQGHIKPMFKVAKLLHLNGFNVTFVNTEFNHKRLLKSEGLASSPGFRFATIPDGLPPSDPDASQDFPTLAVSVCTNFLSPFLKLVEGLNNQDDPENSAGPVTCIVSDGLMMKFTVPASEQLRIRLALFMPFCLAAVMATRYIPTLKEIGFVPFKDDSYLVDEDYLNTAVDFVPGIKDLRLRDFPTFIRTTDQDVFILDFITEAALKTPKDTVIIINSFKALEEEVFSALSSFYPNLLTVGPVDLLLKQVQADPLESMQGSLWKEDTECLQWLDQHKPNSVVYVNFGSITVMTPEQMVEFAWGLANSKHPFLWVIRPDLVIGDDAILPVEFVEETRGRGTIVGWCPQEKVLNHPSIGGFLTHCGWNSALESISAGVPMLCWPFFADQQTNCRFCCKEWGVAVEIDGNVKRDGLEKLVRELMEGDKGKEMKRNVMELRKKALEATSHGGSSASNLQKLIKKLAA